MAVALGSKPRTGTAGQGADRRSVSAGCSAPLHGQYPPVAVPSSLVPAARASGRFDCRNHRPPVAHPGHAAQSTVLCFHPAERTRPVPRLLLVLLPQRTPAPVPEPPLSARLQHGSKALVLAAESSLALPLELFPAGRCPAGLQRRDPRRPYPPHGPVLGGSRHAVFYVLHHAGVLLDADLSCAGALDWLRAERRFRPGAPRAQAAGSRICGAVAHPVCVAAGCVAPACARRHLASADPEP